MSKSKRPKRYCLTTGDLAAACSVSPATIFRAIESGKLSCARTPGGHYRIAAEDANKYLQDAGYKNVRFDPK